MTVEEAEWGRSHLEATPCPVCGAHDWYAPLGGSAWCNECNAEATVRPGNSEGYIVAVFSDSCWGNEHRESIPKVGDDRTGKAAGRRVVQFKYLGAKPQKLGYEWASSTAVLFDDAESWSPAWDRTDAEASADD